MREFNSQHDLKNTSAMRDNPDIEFNIQFEQYHW